MAPRPEQPIRLAPPAPMPEPQARALRAARRLAWWTIAYLISVGIFVYLVLASSQALKAAWLETVFSIVTPIVFLIGARFARKPPTPDYPYGYGCAVSIAFLAASLALAALGLYLLADTVLKVIGGTPPEIGTVGLFGRTVWLGWPILLAMLWSSVPAFFIGRAQEPHARTLHDRVLIADAGMRQADWTTAAAAMIGVFGIQFGLPWLDPLAGGIIALLVFSDGCRNLRIAVGELMNCTPRTVHGRRDPLPDRVRDSLLALDWIADAQVRLREDGHVVFGEAFVVPKTERHLVGKIDDAAKRIEAMDWRLQSVTITVLPSIEADYR